MPISKDAQDRKDTPVFSGVIKYFPDALLEVARVSKVGNDQHNPGEPLHWAKEKSMDEGDALSRHLIDVARDGVLSKDKDGVLHLAKVAWRALAFLQREIERNGRIDCAEYVTELKSEVAHDCTEKYRYVQVGEKIQRGDQYKFREYKKDFPSWYNTSDAGKVLEPFISDTFIYRRKIK